MDTTFIYPLFSYLLDVLTGGSKYMYQFYSEQYHYDDKENTSLHFKKVGSVHFAIYFDPDKKV